MRKLILGMVIWGAISMVLSTKGINFTTWQFWAVFALILVDSINDRV